MDNNSSKENLQKHEIRIMGGWIPPLKREGDIHIGGLPTEFGIDLSIPELRQYHHVFQVLNTTTLSDIVDAFGCFIHELAWSCATQCKSDYTWPEKPIALSRAHKRVWHRVLARPASSSTRQFHLPLGPWIKEPNGDFPFFITPRGLVHNQLDGTWRLRTKELQLMRQTRTSHCCFSGTFTEVEPFRGQRWYTDAYIRRGLIGAICAICAIRNATRFVRTPVFARKLISDARFIAI